MNDDLNEESNQEEVSEKAKAKTVLLKFLNGDNKDNIAEDLDEDVLLNVGNKVLTGFNEDLNSSEEWLRDVKKVEELSILASKKKSYPLPNSANIKYPLITKAVYEFSSRVYPEIVKDGQIVKAKTIGKDFTGEKEVKARKVADYMNWQLYWENDDWELELDRLLNRLALIGFICKKTYYDTVRGIVKSELCEPSDLIINSEIKSLDDARRITHIIHVRLNDLIEGSRAGIYCKEIVEKCVEQHENDEVEQTIDILEQHTYLDLDDDDYAEPYIVTVLRDSGEVLRILPRFNEKGIIVKKKEVARIDAIQIFTDFHFLVSPKGKFQSVGFGILLLHLNETINTILNQLVDAGQLSNLRGGYMDSRLKEIGSGSDGINPGEFVKVKTMGGLNLKDGILPVDYREPSSVLYQLLGLLIEASRDLASSNDVMTGNSTPENSKTGATQALIAEGVKIHNSINKRIYRSLGNEFYKIFTLNGIYLDPDKASKVLDEEITTKDFDQEAVDILPVADPNLASGVKLTQEIQMLQGLMTLPGFDPEKIANRIAMKLAIDKLDELRADPNKEAPPNPEVIKLQAEIQDKAEKNKLSAHELEIEEKRLQIEMYKVQCECLKLKSEAELNVAKAESLEVGDQHTLYMSQLDQMSSQIDQQLQGQQQAHEKEIQATEQAHQQQMQQQEMAAQQQQQAAAGPEAPQ